MMNGQHPDGTSEPSPELYALGALTEEERETFDEFVAEGLIDMDHLKSHLESFTEVCEEVAAAMPAPRKALKERIMAAALADEARSDAPDAGAPAREYAEQMFVHVNQGEWQETGIPGIALKVLYVDAATGRTTFLARLAPGAAYPRHRHAGVEECFVVQGDLVIDGTTLNAGDFTVTMTDKVHSDTHSETGCILLLSSPMNDEFLEGN